MNSVSPLDSDLLKGYVSDLGVDIVKQMLALYDQQSIIYLQEIDQAIDQQCQQLWSTRCHKMKGAAGSVGLIAVFRYLVEIEKSSQSWPEKRKFHRCLSSLNTVGMLCLADYIKEKTSI